MPVFYYIDLVPVEITAQAVATSNTAATSILFSNMAIGSADSNRFVLVPMSWQAAATAVVIQTIMVAGVTATQLVLGGFSGGVRNTGMFIAQVPSGTTANITATFNSPPTNCNIATLSVVGLITAAANGTAASTAAAPTGSLNCDAFGAMIGCAYAGAAAPPTANWSGIVEDYDVNNGLQCFTVAHSNFSTAQSALALTCTFSTTAGSSGCFVAFSPP